MGVLYPVVGTPGTYTPTRVTFSQVFYAANDGYLNLPEGVLVHGAIAGDAGNTGDTDILRPGTLLGKATSGTYSGYYGTVIKGILQGAVSATGTSVTVTPAQAVEIVRQQGTTGTLRFVGPPTANGTVATFTETYSAVNTTTGVITVSALNADLVAGSWVTFDDGTHIPKTFIVDQDGFKVTRDGSYVAAQLYRLPLAGVINEAKFPNWPTDTSIRQFIVDNLNALAGGKFSFKYYY